MLHSSATDLSTPRMTHWCFLYIDVMLPVLTSPVRKGRGEEELHRWRRLSSASSTRPHLIRIRIRCCFMISREVTWAKSSSFCTAQRFRPLISHGKVSLERFLLLICNASDAEARSSLCPYLLSPVARLRSALRPRVTSWPLVHINPEVRRYFSPFFVYPFHQEL